MAGLLRGGLATGLLMVFLAAPAHGFWWRRGYTSSYYYEPAYYAPSYRYYPMAYAYPAPYSYAAPAPYCAPASGYPAVGSVPYIPYAQPRPAPPSSSPSAEPPTGQPGRSPKISESRFASGDGPAKAGDAKDYCKVGFWNLTGRDVTVVVDGQTHSIRRDHAVTLDLSHRFAWKLDSGDLRQERVPAEQRTHEILLRPKAGR